MKSTASKATPTRSRATASRACFREEMDVRQLIKHKNVYEYLEEAIDKCQDVANVIESVIVENV
jgi:uncharacterized protein Yka (UPF0111/DUF47 family)